MSRIVELTRTRAPSLGTRSPTSTIPAGLARNRLLLVDDNDSITCAALSSSGGATRLLLSVLVSWLMLMLLASNATAQTFTTFKHFGIMTNATGFNPQSELVQGPDGALYGTTFEAEGNVRGTVYKVQPDGSGFQVLKWFISSLERNLEGVSPYGGLALSGNTLYGTTYEGGSGNGGTVFKVNTDGTGYAVLKHFTNWTAFDGLWPLSRMMLSGNVLYGTTWRGGGGGTIFKLNTDGTGYAVLKVFDFDGSNGRGPYGGLILSGNVLYGTTDSGGSADFGTVFKVNTDGTGFTVLKHFTGGMDGASPYAGLTLVGDLLYGTTYAGGSSGFGALFRLNTNGTGYTVVKHFTGDDGAGPYADLTLSRSVLYGTTSYGGNSNFGTVFQIQTDGTGYTVLKHFVDDDGAYSRSALTLSSNVLYGTSLGGGEFGLGTIFRLNTDGTGGAVLKHLGIVSTEGRNPSSGLALSGSTVYGTTWAGGTSNAGTVFKLDTDGTGYSVLKHFNDNDGRGPSGNLALSEGVLYGAGGLNPGMVFKVNTDGTGYALLTNGIGSYGGVTLSGGVLYGATAVWGSGAVFKLNTDGTSFTVLKLFLEINGEWPDGAYPHGRLVLSGDTLYGTTEEGGGFSGTVFKMDTDGTDFTIIKYFNHTDGYGPRGLTLSGSTLYGTTRLGGSSEGEGHGVVFRVNTDGTGFTVLKNLAGSDGSSPWSDLTLVGNTLYGTTYYGGEWDKGTVFKLETDGTGFAVLKHFRGSDGANPASNLTFSDNVLYGTTRFGGSWDNGTAFKIDLASTLTPISLAAEVTAGAIILTWSNAAFALQASPSVMGIYTNIPDATSPYTNALSEPQTFFRLLGN